MTAAISTASGRRPRKPTRRSIESAAVQLAARSHAFEQAAQMLDPGSDEAHRLTRRATIAKAAMNRVAELYKRCCKTIAQIAAFWRRLVDALKPDRTPVPFTMTVQRPSAGEPVAAPQPPLAEDVTPAGIAEHLAVDAEAIRTHARTLVDLRSRTIQSGVRDLLLRAIGYLGDAAMMVEAAQTVEESVAALEKVVDRAVAEDAAADVPEPLAL